MQSHSDISNLKAKSTLRYELAAGARFFSAALAQLGVSADTPAVLVCHGEVTIRSKFTWRSVLMSLHGVFVFLGWQNFGRSALYLSYGLPWSSKACLVMALVIRERRRIEISRKHALCAYAAELDAVNFSPVRLWRWLAWLTVPRSGWQK